MRGLIISILLLMLLSSAFVVAIAPQPKIQVTLLNQDPDPVKQGDVVEVRFKIENTGIETIDNVQVKISPDYPFSLYNGKTTYDLGKLRAGQSGADAVIVDYKLLVDEDSAEGDNEIELEVKIGAGFWKTYTDDDFLIDVEDYDFPEIKVYVKDTDVKIAGQKGNVVVEIANTNLEDVKFLQMTLLKSADYELLSSSNYVYIGDVDSDDTESEEFEIYIEPGVKEFLMLPIKLEYQDSNEKDYSGDYMLKLRLFDSEETKKFGLSTDNRTALYSVAIIVLLIIGYFIWRRKFRKR